VNYAVCSSTLECLISIGLANEILCYDEIGDGVNEKDNEDYHT